jgi:uridine kinase
MSQPYLVGISGGSASGKTRLVEELSSIFGTDDLTVISQDNYYRDIENQRREPDGSVNFDHPDAVDLELLYSHMRRLLEGETVRIREYTFNNPALKPRMLTYEPNPIIVIEGLFVFYYRPIAELLDLKIYVDADEHLKLSRRLRRDSTERGYAMNDILNQYEKQTMPMYQQYVRPYRSESDLLVYNNRHFKVGARVIVNHLKTVIGQNDN